jgi:nicotinamide riboside kinase
MAHSLRHFHDSLETQESACIVDLAVSTFSMLASQRSGNFYMMKIVLTGGPSGGKTTLAQTLQKELTSHVTVIPEAASIVFGGGWPRRKSLIGVQHQQKAIYFLQRELESLLWHENQDRLLICDRGSLDGVAYWPGPGSGTDFFQAVGTTLEREIRRYDWVIHLDTAPASFYDVSNPLRNENFEEAWRLNESIKEAWNSHPQRFVIENREGAQFLEKLQRALFVVERIIEGKTFAEINSEMLSDP